MLIQGIFLYYRENCHRQCKGAAGTAATRGKTGKYYQRTKTYSTKRIRQPGDPYSTNPGSPRTRPKSEEGSTCRRVSKNVKGCRRVSKSVEECRRVSERDLGQCGGLRSGS